MERRGFRINDRAATLTLTKAFMRHGRGRNRILSGAAALGMLVLCIVFGISIGKIETEYISALRSRGSLACTFLEDGTMAQYANIKGLPYIESAGVKKTAGQAHAGEEFLGEVVMLDKTGWEELTAPAYGQIKGRYPQHAEEIMLSLRTLETLGMKEPKIGDAVELRIQIGLFKEKKEIFTLCGWYTDYVEPETHIPQCYVAEEKFEEWGIDTEKPDYILMKQKDDMSGEKVEEKLYRDIPVVNKSQQFIGGDTVKSQVLESFVGGYGAAGICAFLILLSVFLVITNVFCISFSRDIQSMGQLTSLGATKRQIRKIYYRQMGNVLIRGLFVGAVLSAVVMMRVVPKLLQNLYLYRMGEVSVRYWLHPEIGVAAAVGVALAFLAASAYAVHKTVDMPPWEALKYTGIPAKRKEGRPGKKRKEIRNEIAWMAARNVLRTPKQFWMTVLSLVLGVCVALSAAVITRGMDETNEIAGRADFRIRANGIQEVSKEGEWIHMYDEFSPFSESVKEKILSIQGLKEERTIIKGIYMEVAYGEKTLKPLTDAELDRPMSDEEHAQYTFPIANLIRVVDEEYVKELEDYVEENGLKTDISLFKSGEGVLLLHDHALSPEMEKEADKVIGEEIVFAHLLDKEEKEKRLGLSMEELMKLPDVEPKTEKMKMAGYLDTAEKGFPKLKGETKEENILYFLVTPKGAEHLNSAVKILGFDLNVEKQREPAAKAAIERILQEENAKDEYLGLSLESKSDDLSKAENLIMTSRLLMGGIGAVLILMGILNYLYVIAMSTVSRKKEFQVLESVGMTKRQRKRMLMLEGTLYWTVVLAGVLAVGIPAMKILGIYMSGKVSYFRFFWPWREFLVSMVLLGVFCVAVSGRKELVEVDF